MTNEDLNTALYKKMFSEQEHFKQWLLTQPPEEILRHTYEYTVREDILLSLEYHDLTDAQANALMQSPSPLADVFKDFEKRETYHMDIIWECLEYRADALLTHSRQLWNTPLYLPSASYAQEHGELDQYRASRRANIACKDAIEAAIREHYHDNRLDKQAAESIIEAFGLDRTLYVLANTVQQKHWDGRFSPDTKAWANSFSIQKNVDTLGIDRNYQFAVHSHPGLTDLFIQSARKYCVQPEKEEKNSVLERLEQPVHNSPKISANYSWER